MRRIVVEQPEPGPQEVAFRWRVEPPTELYSRESFNLRFGGDLDPGRVPADIWWIVALLCLHGHWALLRPCRVELPVELPPGEREFWLRLLDAAVETLELGGPGGDRTRAIEILDRGPRLEPAAPPAGERVALAFGGGKDSLLTLGLLLELGEHPLAVTTTAPMPLVFDHAAPRRRTALETVSARADADLVEVRSNLRECWDNDFARRRGYGLAVADLSDPMLYLGAALAIGWDRGASRILLGSAAELQTIAEADGGVVRQPRFAGGAIALGALDRLLSRRGVTVGSLTYPLRAWQIRRLLWSRYPRLAEVQYSCRRHAPAESACNGCRECLAASLAALRAGAGPARAGVDVTELLDRFWEWRPRLDEGELPEANVRRELHGSVVRELAATRTRRFALGLARAEPRRLLGRDGPRTLRRYAALRGRLAGGAADVPAPGYGHAYLRLVDERWRQRLERLFDAELDRAPAAADGADLARALELIERISEPLAVAGEDN